MAIGRHNTKMQAAGAFTLVELMLLMALMVIMVALVMPSMAAFFRGRNLDNEAMQFLSLTRYGQSRAISEGIPVELWINPKAGSYGLSALSGYSETQTNPMIYNVDSTVKIGFSAPTSVLVRSNYWTQAQGQMGTVARIRFQPDGFISDTSPQSINLRQDSGRQIWIAETPTHLRYDIQNSQPSR
jgi:type II secretion system protein H